MALSIEDNFPSDVFCDRRCAEVLCLVVCLLQSQCDRVWLPGRGSGKRAKLGGKLRHASWREHVNLWNRVTIALGVGSAPPLLKPSATASPIGPECSSRANTPGHIAAERSHHQTQHLSTTLLAVLSFGIYCERLVEPCFFDNYLQRDTLAPPGLAKSFA